MLAPAAVAFAIAFAATPVVLRVLRQLNVIDVPGCRSSHAQPTPRGGGIAPALGVVVAALLSAPLDGSARNSLLIAAGGVGALGLADDVRQVSPFTRLSIQFLVAALALPWLLHGLSGPLAWQMLFATGVLVWFVSFVNAFNFMDGIDGLAVSQVVVAGVAWYAIGRLDDVDTLAAGGAILGAAALGFAPFNAVRAKVFLGDVGSYFLGGTLAVVAVLALRAGLPPEAIIAPLAVSLVDTGVTLVRRIRRRELWSQPHRDHTYQWLVQNGYTHVRATLFAATLMVACSLLGAVSLSGDLRTRVAADLALLTILVGYAALPYLVAPPSWTRLARHRAGVNGQDTANESMG